MGLPAKVSNICEEAAALPREATIYGIRELARRAGVSREMFRTWQVVFDDAGQTTVFVEPGTDKRIRIPCLQPKVWKEIQSGIIRTSVASAPSFSGGKLLFPSKLIVPFSSDDPGGVGPLFAIAAPDLVECRLDLAASTVLMLSRFEETLPHARDEHDRFSGFSSLAWQEGFLHRPVVDEWGIAFALALGYLLPGWQSRERRLRVKLGHDADILGIPMIFRTTVAHTLRRGRPDATLRDLVSLCAGVDTAYQRCLRQLVQHALDRGLGCAVYWKCSASGPHDTGYDPRNSRIQRMIAEFSSKGVEMGVHPGYQSFRAPQRLRQEITALQGILGDRRLGGRQDFLRWSPESWREWEGLGLAYDASVGFADRTGFRAGTCHPYRPWILSLGREADLLEIPLIAMDSTLQAYMRLTPDEALQNLRDCVAACRAVGGVFSLVWHNTTMMHSGYSNTYRRLLDELTGSEAYEGTNCSDELW